MLLQNVSCAANLLCCFTLPVCPVLQHLMKKHYTFVLNSGLCDYFLPLQYCVVLWCVIFNVGNRVVSSYYRCTKMSFLGKGRGRVQSAF